MASSKDNMVDPARGLGESDTNRTKPGKLNLKNFQKLSDTFARMNLSDINRTIDDGFVMVENPKIINTRRNEENLESSNSNLSSSGQNNDGYSSDHQVTNIKQHTQAPIPVQLKKIPAFEAEIRTQQTFQKAKHMQTVNQDVPDCGPSIIRAATKEDDKQVDLKSKLKEEEKLKKRQFKEEAKLRKQQDKEKEQEQKSKRIRKKSSSAPELASSLMLTDDEIPIFLHNCIQFIEKKGLNCEGIYRVPGNRCQVDLLFQKFEEDSKVDIESLDISVNAVATALKEFFSKRYPPLFEKVVMAELEEIAGLRQTSSSKMTDYNCHLTSLRKLVNKLPTGKFNVLMFIFKHLVRVSQNSASNCMESKNLAICWWPTLIPIDFISLEHFEQRRPYLEDIVQSLIDQFPYVFCGDEAIVMF